MLKFVISTLLATALAISTPSIAAGISQEQIDAMRREREAIGIYNFVKKYPETNEIEFTYGSPEHRRMTFTEFSAFVRERIADYTLTSAPSQIGYQIEYYGADGQAWLWYPGNEKTTVGKWTLRESMEPFNMFGDRAGVLICFDYGPESYNPETGKQGGEECTSAYAFIAAIRGKRRGDVFNLMTGKPPFAMTRKRFPKKWPDGEPLISPRAPHN